MTICPIRSRNFHFGWLQPCSLASAESRCRRRRLGTRKEYGQGQAAAIKVTGCLQKGELADEFAITGENGKTWELRSRTVKLGDHVGHTVTIYPACVTTKRRRGSQGRKDRGERKQGSRSKGSRRSARHQSGYGQRICKK